MSKPYAQQKGGNWERNVSKILEQEFKIFGYKFRRTPSQERWKSYSGDVNCINCPQNSIFRDLHLECQSRKNPSIFPKLKKTIDDGKPKDGILITKKTGEPLEIVSMSLKSFLKLILELEGYRQDEK